MRRRSWHVFSRSFWPNIHKREPLPASPETQDAKEISPAGRTPILSRRLLERLAFPPAPRHCADQDRLADFPASDDLAGRRFAIFDHLLRHEKLAYPDKSVPPQRAGFFRRSDDEMLVVHARSTSFTRRAASRPGRTETAGRASSSSSTASSARRSTGCGALVRRAANRRARLRGALRKSVGAAAGRAARLGRRYGQGERLRRGLSFRRFRSE